MKTILTCIFIALGGLIFVRLLQRIRNPELSEHYQEQDDLLGRTVATNSNQVHVWGDAWQDSLTGAENKDELQLWDANAAQENWNANPDPADWSWAIEGRKSNANDVGYNRPESEQPIDLSNGIYQYITNGE
jgi:hypothetical protein